MTDSIDDARVVFYLKHRELIETWAAVKDDVSREAHAFYLSLANDLESEAADLVGDVAVWVRDGTWSNVGLYRRDWYGETGPLIAATFEWSSKATFHDGMRIVGLRVHREDEQGRDIRDTVAAEVQSVRPKSGFIRYSQIWPAYRDASGPENGEFWLDTTSFRQTLIDSILEAWSVFEEPATRAFEVWSTSR